MKTELHKVKLIMFPSIVNIKFTEKNHVLYIYVNMHNSKEVGENMDLTNYSSVY